jgi:hypothetical protein
MQNEKLINAIFEAHKMGFEEVVKKIAMQNPDALIEATLGIEIKEEQTVAVAPTPNDDNENTTASPKLLALEKEIEQEIRNEDLEVEIDDNLKKILKDFQEYDGLEDLDDFVIAKFQPHELKPLARAMRIGKIYLEKARNAKIDDKQWTPKYEKFAKWMKQYKINDYMTKVVWFNITDEKTEKTPEQEKKREEFINKFMEGMEVY